MAAIVPITGGLRRSATAQATVGQTDWLNVPSAARYCQVWFSLSAVAGTSPTATLSLLAAEPIARDDARIINLGEHAGLTAMTGAADLVVDIGPGVTGIANDVTNAAAADSWVSLNVNLPGLLGVKLVLDRADGDETYTYNLSALFR